jgi:hypothetical protein
MQNSSETLVSLIPTLTIDIWFYPDFQVPRVGLLAGE